MAEASITRDRQAERTPPPRRALVRLERVGKVFANGVVALDELDLCVGEHEFVSLLGPSGCGKSTALRLIAGLSEASAGRLVWADTGGPLRRPRRDIGFVFQEPTLRPWATAGAMSTCRSAWRARAGAVWRHGSMRRSPWSDCPASRAPIRASCPAA